MSFHSFNSVQVLQSVLASMSEGVVVWNRDGAAVACNDAATRILGMTSADLVGRNANDVEWRAVRTDGAALSAGERPVNQVLRTGQPSANVVFGLQSAAGVTTWIRVTAAPLFAADGSLDGVTTTFVDVSELQHDVLRLGQAMAGANVGTWEYDVAADIARRDAAWAGIVGETLADIEPTMRGLTSRVHPDDERAVAGLPAAWAHDDAFLVDARLRHKDGAYRWVQIRGRVVARDDQGRARRVAGVLVNVEARKRLEGALRDALTDNERLVEELRASLAKVRALEGILPICMYCKSIRADDGKYVRLESYIEQRSRAQFSHGMCESCCAKHFPGLNDDEA